jgi:hypothetical protein
VLEQALVQLVLQVGTPVLALEVALLVLLGDTALQTIAEAALFAPAEGTREVQDRELVTVALLVDICLIVDMVLV